MTKTRLFTRKLFIETIEAFRLQYHLDNKKAQILSGVHGADVEPYNNSMLTNILLKLLQTEFEPDNALCDIEYFMYELNFGAKYKRGMVLDTNKKPVDFSTPSKLYDYIISR